MERQNFEKGFKQVFDGAEQTPSEGTWVNIELELERAEGKKMRRSVFMYKMLAAASVTFALLIAGAGVMVMRSQQDNLTATLPATEITPNERDNAGAQQNDETERSGLANADTSIGSGDRTVSDLSRNGNAARERISGNRSVDQMASSETGSPESQRNITKDISAPANKSEVLRENPIHQANDPVVVLPEEILKNNEAVGEGLAVNTPSEITLDSNDGVLAESVGDPVSSDQRSIDNHSNIAKTPDEATAEADPVELMLARLNDLEKELAAQGAGKKKNRKESGKENLWTSLGFAAGGYNGQSNAIPAPSNALAMNNAVDNQTKASGVAYSVNISMGKRITDRFVIQGGVSYLNNSTNYTSNQVVRADNMDFKPATIKDLRAAESSLYTNNLVIPTAPHSVNNSIEFVSVPVQAGYIIIDRRLGFQFNAGVSTDFFIQNTIDPQSSDLKKTTQERGSDSPYRATNFSGLMSTEVTYKLGEHYRLALNPGIRYPFNSIYKDDTGIESTPLTFDVGIRFRYIFR